MIQTLPSRALGGRAAGRPRPHPAPTGREHRVRFLPSEKGRISASLRSARSSTSGPDLLRVATVGLSAL